MIAVGLNLTLAHYREAAGSFVSDAGQEVLVRLRTNPLGIMDVKSWLFFGIGMLCSLIAFGDSYLIFDPYPGYGMLEKRRAAAYEAYIARKNELIATLLSIRDEAIEILEEANRDLSVRRSEHDAILEGRTRLAAAVRSPSDPSRSDRQCAPLHLSGSQQAVEKDAAAAPVRRGLCCSRRSRPSNDVLPASARDDLRRSIEESQTVLADQVRAIHDEFERAFATYREIDDLVEEQTIAKSNAKAA